MQWSWRGLAFFCSRADPRASFCSRADPPASTASLLRAWVFALCLLLGLSLAPAPQPARADAAEPHDVVQGPGALQVPAAPREFIQRNKGRVRFAFHPQDEGIATRLMESLPKLLRSVADELGAARDQELEVRIARSPAEMARLAPRGAPPPGYAVGVAYPALGLVILSVVDPQSWLPPDLTSVLTHELSHIVLHRAVDGRPLPLWFVEGMAVYQAREQRLSRIQVLWEAAVLDEVLTTAELSTRFPTRPRQVNLAYAQSADLVQHLLRSEANRSYLTALLREVRAGHSFDQALLAAYGVDLPYFEHDWRRSLGERYRVLPMVLTGTALWGGIAVLVVVAFFRRRKDQRQKLSRWAEEEAREDRAQAERAALPTLSASATEPSPELFMIAAHTRDSAVPTIEHEGQRHTLH